MSAFSYTVVTPGGPVNFWIRSRTQQVTNVQVALPNDKASFEALLGRIAR